MPVAVPLPPLVEYQIALERLHFSCGFIDGEGGDRTARMLAAFQRSRNLPVTGQADAATWQALAAAPAAAPFTTYTVTQADFDAVLPAPTTWLAKSQAPSMAYNDIWEVLGAKFHSKRSWLRQLNPDQNPPAVGSVLRVPNLQPQSGSPPIAAASVKISLSGHWIEALDGEGRPVAHFPCSIAKDKDKRPEGSLFVQVIAAHPNYTFDPKLFADAAQKEGITHRLVIPPGPKNPVGSMWIGLSLPTYGIHGTPEPENIARTGSHGCFRLADWNAEALARMVRIGTPVDVEP